MNFEQVKLFFKERSNFGIKPGLDRIKYLLKLCGHPEKTVSTVHVAGTNGKGSTIQYMKSALMTSGYHVGVFSSPSLEGIRGHMTVNGEQITIAEFISLLNELYPKIIELDQQHNHPTEFEIITVIAFLFFQRHAQIALIETGMGGRGDTTNCIEPLLSIITSVDFDHMEFLGDTIENIAYEKAGIIKKDRPVIIGEVVNEAKMTIKKVANELNAPIYELANDFSYTETKMITHGQKFVWTCKAEQFTVAIEQKGPHQIKNSSLAIMGLVLLKQNGLHIDTVDITNGFKKVTIPGRFEQIKSKPLIVVDGAHNVAGIKAFLHTIQISDQNPNKVLVFAAFKDKDINSMLQELLPHFSTIILTTFNHPRAATVSELHTLVQSVNKNIDVVSWNNFKREISSYIRSTKDISYYFTGSLHFIKEVKNFLK